MSNPFDAATQHLPAIVRYDIIDRQTGAIVGTTKKRAIASAMVTRRDNAYGAYRFHARIVLATDKGA
jgi:hypothetical protein